MGIVPCPECGARHPFQQTAALTVWAIRCMCGRDFVVQIGHPGRWVRR